MTAPLPIADAHQHFWDPHANYLPWLCDPEPIAFRYGDYSALKRRYLPEEHARGFVQAELGRPSDTFVLFTVRPDRWIAFDFGEQAG